MSERIWRLTFLVIYLTFMAIRSYYSKETSNGELCKAEADRQLAVEREGKTLFTIRMIVSDLMLFGIFVYVVGFDWVSYFKIDLPQSLRLGGGALGVGALPFIAWVHSILDKQFSPDLELKDNHQLITSGPYEIVRHPMYTGLFAFMLGVSLMSANLMVLVPHLMAIIIHCFRIEREEAMLIDKFGQEYKDYMEETGRIIPKLI